MKNEAKLYECPTSAQTLNLTDKLRYDIFFIHLYKYEITSFLSSRSFNTNGIVGYNMLLA